MFNPDGTILELKSGRWAISRDGIHLVERAPVTKEREAHEVLTKLGIPLTPGNLDHFFPRDVKERRCPTFELMKRWHQYHGKMDSRWKSTV